ncbi:cell division-specific peptidoglycan biosynthesis regulator FtsW [Geothermobacter ehrlichii]|uniref:Probable peptidoglycan glycosyltransferase FtsW n=1 Tax=Geothermobacter ehrlichii TaxID=213224 RepID=A0A5D3WHD9_9BACT|nr:putative lipid II flippase FtsW [Geothermobacter ehrlichii]TYO96093.1 cell division-specific peptidoglycan biosynthesis regulator FtsW [Geothermobacter ehrlichii]
MEIRRGHDQTLLMLATVLTCFGIVMVYSSSSIMAAEKYADGFLFLKRQGIFACIGLLLMAGLMHVDYHRLRRLAVPLLLLCTLLLVVVFIPGVGVRAGGASRWIRLPFFSLQPSELAKLGLVVFMAHSLARKGEKIKTLKVGFLPYMVLLAVLLVLVLAQPDLGGAATMGVVALCLLLVAGSRWRHLFGVVVLALPFLYFLVMNVDYRRRRIMAFLNPWDDPTDTGFQIIQSWIAFGTGGWFGNGLGEGKQKLFFLPEAHTDFIFAVVGEELGFVGVVVTAALFLVLVLRGIRTAVHAPDEFGRYLAFGLTVLIGIEAFTNFAVVLGLLPTKGLALPFLSYGGTNLVCTLMEVGILLNISAKLPGEVR